ncbi:MAG: LptF/LptG family permease [Acidobacteria bacterium]|nr:LptF/LptG family permease [Acidobacteriota bacterium]
MFRIIDRYIIKEILPYFFLSLLLLTAIIFVHEANRFSELFVIFSRRGLSSRPLLALVISLLPSILVFTLPISLLLGILMGLGRMASDSELVVLRAGGLGRWRLLLPVLLLAIFVSGFTAYNTAYLLPHAMKSLNVLKKTHSQLLLKGLTDQVKPGVFEESIPGKLIFIRDIDREQAKWKQVFVAIQEGADTEPKILIAREGALQIGESLELSELQLYNGYIYEGYQLKRKDQEKAATYSFTNTSLRLNLSSNKTTASDNQAGINTQAETKARSEINVLSEGPEAQTLPELFRSSIPTDRKQQLLLSVEKHKRFALPMACLVFALTGVALGMVVSRGGRSSGLIIGIGVTLSYYLLFILGEDIARQGVVPAFIGVWIANISLSIFGLLMLARYQWVRDRVIGIVESFYPVLKRVEKLFQTEGRKTNSNKVTFGFPRIIDRMILSDMLRHFLVVLLGLTSVFLVFTLFELTNNIVENKIGFITVANYLLFLTPQIFHYAAPFSVLVAVLVTFGLFGKSSQLVALNASGQSLYRLALPVLLYSLIAGGFLFVSQEYVLPFANRRQEYLRYVIKGGQLQAQTFYQNRRKWFLAKDNRLINFQYFDTKLNKFAGLSIYELDTESGSLLRRISSKEASWDTNTQEWVLNGGFIRTYEEGSVKSIERIRDMKLKLGETPEYFKQQTPESSKMSIEQLLAQIKDLGESGVDILSLQIALHTKIANPFTCLVMALMGIPFAFAIGKRGALAGVGVSIFIAIAFWGSLELFNQLGRYELLPPMLSAWGPNLLFATSGIYMLFTTKT